MTLLGPVLEKGENGYYWINGQLVKYFSWSMPGVKMIIEASTDDAKFLKQNVQYNILRNSPKT